MILAFLLHALAASLSMNFETESRSWNIIPRLRDRSFCFIVARPRLIAVSRHIIGRVTVYGS